MLSVVFLLFLFVAVRIYSDARLYSFPLSICNGAFFSLRCGKRQRNRLNFLDGFFYPLFLYFSRFLYSPSCFNGARFFLFGRLFFLSACVPGTKLLRRKANYLPLGKENIVRYRVYTRFHNNKSVHELHDERIRKIHFTLRRIRLSREN